MLCPQCGEPNQMHAVCCIHCGCLVEEQTPLELGNADRICAGPVRQMKIPNHLWLSVLMLVICLPMGAAALVYSVRVEKYVMQQDYPAAREASFRARKISMLGLMIMAAATAAYFLCMAALMLVVN